MEDYSVEVTEVVGDTYITRKFKSVHDLILYEKYLDSKEYDSVEKYEPVLIKPTC